MVYRSWIDILLPKTIDNAFEVNPLFKIAFLSITIVGIVVSLIHLFLPGGGSETFAGINLTVAGGPDIVAVVALWGMSEIILNFFFLVVYIRYKSLIPFAFLLTFFLYAGQLIVGVFKPLNPFRITPGIVEGLVLAPLCLALLLLTLTLPDNAHN